MVARQDIETDPSYAAMVKLWLAWSLALEDLIREEGAEALLLFATQAEFHSTTQSGLAYFRKNKPNDKSLHSLHKTLVNWIDSWQQFFGNRLKRSSSRTFVRAQLMMDLDKFDAH